MSVIGAETRFSALVKRARAARSTIITKMGKPVARIVPERVEERDRSKVLNEAEAFR